MFVEQDHPTSKDAPPERAFRFQAGTLIEKSGRERGSTARSPARKYSLTFII